jgi:phosphoserine phosphatase RsbU/P
MSTDTVRFGDTTNSARLAYFDQMLDAVATATDVRELHGSLVEIMRRIFGVSCYVEVTTEGLPPSQYRVTRVWRENDTEGVPNRSPWRSEGVPARAGGIIADVIGRAQPSFIPAFSFPADDPLFEELGEYHTMAATPGALGQRDHWVFVFDTRAGKFTSEDLEHLILRVMLIGSALRNLRTAIERDEAHRKLTAATAFIQAEVDRIAMIQRALLPPPEPKVPGLSVAAWSETFDRAGGDLYDYVALPSGHWVCLVADASGHGPSAAVVAGILSTMLHTLLGRSHSPLMTPTEILSYANEQLVLRRIEQSFVTAFVAIWDPLTRSLLYSRAGHNPPLVRRKRDGAIIELSAVGGLPLGIFPESQYEQAELRLSSGDIVLIFSDGIVEAGEAAGEPFDVEGVRRVIAEAADCSAPEVLLRVRSAVQVHQKTRPTDDQTLLVLKAT